MNMASRFTIYSINQISDLIYQTSYIIYDIYSILEYADIVWDNCTQYELNVLEKIQIEAARIVNGTTKLISVNLLYQEIGWEPLTQRRTKHKLHMFYKMSNDLSPAYLTSLVPSSFENTVYSLRDSQNIRPVLTRTQLYYKSFIPSSIREWNELPFECHNSDSLTIFKHQLNKNLPNIPKYYSYGLRNLQIQHTRLRTECSSLNQHLFSKNIIDNPLCTCGEVESTRHFLLDCSHYDEIRVAMLNNISAICNPSLNVLLYGDCQLDNRLNETIFREVQIFIAESKRFDR